MSKIRHVNNIKDKSIFFEYQLDVFITFTVITDQIILKARSLLDSN